MANERLYEAIMRAPTMREKLANYLQDLKEGDISSTIEALKSGVGTLLSPVSETEQALKEQAFRALSQPLKDVGTPGTGFFTKPSVVDPHPMRTRIANELGYVSREAGNTLETTQNYIPDTWLDLLTLGGSKLVGTLAAAAIPLARRADYLRMLGAAPEFKQAVLRSRIAELEKSGATDQQIRGTVQKWLNKGRIDAESILALNPAEQHRFAGAPQTYTVTAEEAAQRSPQFQKEYAASQKDYELWQKGVQEGNIFPRTTEAGIRQYGPRPVPPVEPVVRGREGLIPREPGQSVEAYLSEHLKEPVRNEPSYANYLHERQAAEMNPARLQSRNLVSGEVETISPQDIESAIERTTGTVREGARSGPSMSELAAMEGAGEDVAYGAQQLQKDLQWLRGLEKAHLLSPIDVAERERMRGSLAHLLTQPSEGDVMRLSADTGVLPEAPAVQSSWWANAPREGFSRRAEAEVPRMTMADPSVPNVSESSIDVGRDMLRRQYAKPLPKADAASRLDQILKRLEEERARYRSATSEAAKELSERKGAGYTRRAQQLKDVVTPASEDVLKATRVETAKAGRNIPLREAILRRSAATPPLPISNPMELLPSHTSPVATIPPLPRPPGSAPLEEKLDYLATLLENQLRKGKTR